VVVAKDTPGFIVNRLMLPELLNAIRMLESGTATREDIDSAIVLGLNHPLGPLALADLIGLDITLSLSNTLYSETKDPQFAPPVLLNRMVSAGWLGRKKGKGFYDYK
jgi:3-hydroxybutyryl-CoA dehydrogenase